MKNATIELINWFRNLGTIGKAAVISLFLQTAQIIGNLFNWVKENIANAFSSAVLSVKQLWAGFLAWLAETSAQILSKIPGFKDLAQGLREETAKLRQYIEQLKQEKIQLKADFDKTKVLEELNQLKEAIRQTKTDIPIDAEVSPLKEKLSQLSEIPISKEVRLSPETSEIEREIEKLSSMEIVVPVKFVAEGDYSPSWE